jgi:hypothetical protein
MINYKRLLLIIFATFLFLPVWTQSFNTQQIQLAERLDSLAKNAPPELPYIQTSKDIYETGEDLWFKVYLLDAQYLIPSLLSKTLYLQLLNEYTKKVVWEEKYEIQHGFANGRVYLESTLPEGDYLLAAYTPNSFFSDTSEFKALRRIKIKNNSTSQPLITEKSDKQFLIKPLMGNANAIQFTTFPEGGDMVSGIQSKLAFKAVNTNGEPIDASGTLYEDLIPLVTFKSVHAGMGSLEFKPIFGKKYTIRLSEPAIDSTFLLPEIHTTGMTMKLVGRDKESISLIVSQIPEVNQEAIYLRVQSRGVVYGMTMAKLNGELRIKIPLADLPQGIVEVTLFNSNLVPVAERLVYINYDRKLYIAAGLSNEIYPTRGKATLKITVKDENGKPIVANFGVTVFDKLYQNPRDSNNILTHYYLSSQLKGRIYNPSFYFNSNNKGRDEALDLLMLTQGWRKYTWCEENLSKKAKAQQVINDGIEGFVITRRKMSELKQSFVIAYSPNIDSTKVWILADSTGRFSISPEYFKKWQGEYVYMKPLSSSRVNIPIKLLDPFETINSIRRNNEFIYSSPAIIKEKTEISDTNIASNGIVRIKEVTIKGSKSKGVRGKYLGSLDSLDRLSTADYVCRYNVLNCRNHPNLFDNRKPVEGAKYLVESGGGYLYEVYHARQGPKLTEKQLLKMYNLSKTKAYFNSREFYNPNYDKENAENNLPDFRNTLLWEPSVITDEKGEATLSFYCSDIYTDFIGRIEGVSSDGLLGTEYFNFTVRKLKLNH